MNPTKNPGKEQLIKLYTEQNLSKKKIASMYGVTPPTVNRWLIKEGVHQSEKKYPDAETLRELYVNRKLPAYKIGEQYELSERTIRMLLSQYQIRKEKPANKGGQRTVLFPGRDALLQMAEQGMTVDQIAETCKAADNTVYHWLQHEGIRLIRLQYDMKDGIPYGVSPGRDALMECVNNGMSLPEIAEKYKRSVSTVNKWIKEENVPMKRGRRKITDVPDRETFRQIYVVERRKRNEIAEAYHVSVATVSRWAWEYGLWKNAAKGEKR